VPAIDSCQKQVVNALGKDGWTIAPNPPYLDDQKTAIYIDIEATRPTNGSQEDRHIYVEVKCFPGHNATQELYIAFGQYIIYRAFLAQESITVPLFLAVPRTNYDERFHPAIRKAIKDNQVKLIIVDIETGTIVQWLR
jgi:hypothetical protein